jgi:hypothetical protein
MGQCTYYFKMKFPSKAKAKKAAIGVAAFLQQAADAIGVAAFHMGQRHFWKEFETHFPLIAEYLKEQGVWGNKNELSRKFDFGQNPKESFKIEDDVLSYTGIEVGHMMNWTAGLTFLLKKYGAVKFVWSSEEDGCGSLDGLNLYEWEEIVKAVLTCKSALPALLGLHPDLDSLIQEQLKQE